MGQDVVFYNEGKIQKSGLLSFFILIFVFFIQVVELIRLRQRLILLIQLRITIANDPTFGEHLVFDYFGGPFFRFGNILEKLTD